MRIHFVRHCRPLKSSKFQAKLWPLDPLVSLDETRLKHQLHALTFDRIVSSEEHKAIETAGRLFGHGGFLAIDPHFNELQRGPFIEAYDEQVQAVFRDPAVSIADWEPAETCLQRCLTGLKGLMDRKLSLICVVGHGLQGALLRAQALGEPYAEHSAWKSIRMPDRMIVEMTADRSLSLIEDFSGIAMRN